MRGKLLIVAVSIALPAGGCGTFVVEGPSPALSEGPPNDPACTDSVLLPVVDLAGAAGSMTGAAAYLLATNREERRFDSDVVVGLGGLAAMGLGWSAQRGYGKVEACREVVERATEAARRSHAAEGARGGGRP